ncbi:DBH-like monooxygenase protein 2, partial [Anneissia japonica]|uniref:DBH-like monooxygenase protein 2 n=1 Tax=Anneissia japonica TaxID=1529436 RepID=UPI0014257922
MLLKSLLPVFVINYSALVLIAGFQHNAMLDLQENVQLLWSVDGDTITFEVRANTTGYIKIGLSPDGEMNGADVMVGWVKDGKPYISDRHGVRNQPVKDTHADYELLYGSETDGLTVLGYRRKLLTCDPDDWDITTDTVKVMWAYDPEDPESTTATINEPDQSGVRSIIFVGIMSSDLKSVPDNVQTLDILADEVLVPSNKPTTYWCSHVALPVFQDRQHVIRIDPILQKENEGLVYTFSLMVCPDLPDAVKTDMSQSCRDLFGYDICTKIIYGWGIGGGPLVFPDHVGFSIGGPGSPRYMRLRVHYDNPQLKEGIRDVTGVRLYYTSKLRQFDADNLEVGIPAFLEWIIPPGMTVFKTYGYCNNACTKKMFADSDMKIFSVYLHAHLVATAIRLAHFRDGKYIGDIARDNFFDSNLREQRQLKEEYVVKPGDELMIECIYDTSSRDKVTTSGVGTTSEMCVAFLFYYPRVNVLECASAPDALQLASFLQYDPSPGDTIHNIQGLSELNWTNERKKASARWYIEADHMLTCTNISGLVEDSRGPPPVTKVDPISNLVEELNSQVEKAKCNSASNQQATWYIVTLCTIAITQGFLVWKMWLKEFLTVFLINYLFGNLVLIAGFQHNAMLDLQENVQIFWSVEDDMIIFEIRANTTGYIGIGFSPNGGMKGADIVLGWVKDGTPYISDRHGIGNQQPVIDSQSDYELLYGSETDGLTVLGYRRKLFGIDPLIQKKNEGVVHHFGLKICKDLHDDVKRNMSQNCMDMVEIDMCFELVFGWAVGGGPLIFPDNVGYNFGGPDSPRYMQLQVHYDNPQLQEGVRDASGVRLYYTPELRPFEAGMLEVGIPTFLHWYIPPGVTEFNTYGYCSNTCTEKMFADSDMKIFGVTLHAHLAAIAMRLTHFRDGKYIGDVLRDKFYDFNLQEQRILEEEWIVKAGDELVVECTYSTSERDTITVSGLGTMEEMCVAFILYYPKVSALECASAPDALELSSFLDFDVSPGDSSYHVAGLFGLDWTNERKIASIEWYKEAKHVMSCTNSSGYPLIGEY